MPDGTPTESRQAEREERWVMPRSAAPPPGLPPRRRSRSRLEQAALDARRHDERAFLRLAAQLHALECDIHTARVVSRRAKQGVGSSLHAQADPLHSRAAGERVRLRNGADILIRPIEPQDADELRAAFERLGAVSRYRRFLSEIDHLTPHQVEYLTRIDHHDHEALCALVAATGRGIGAARFVRDAADSRQAEVAIVVVDDWQRRGVGAALAERLMRRAREVGIERVIGRTIVGNEPAIALFTRSGDVVRERRGAGTIELTLRLADRPPERGQGATS
jgi:RimJ/RimL family protein N-acetyltransferase